MPDLVIKKYFNMIHGLKLKKLYWIYGWSKTGFLKAQLNSEQTGFDNNKLYREFRDREWSPLDFRISSILRALFSRSPDIFAKFPIAKKNVPMAQDFLPFIVFQSILVVQ